MAEVENMSAESPDPFDPSIVETYYRLLREDPELTMPVAAIEALIHVLQHSHATTVFETLNLLAVQSSYLKSRVPNPISLSAGTDLFQRYMVSSIGTSGEASLETIRQHLVSNGRLFAMRAKAARERIATYGRRFVRDGCTVLTHGGSRAVGALLTAAAGASASAGSVHFKVIYVMNGTRTAESKVIVSSLRAMGVPVATVSDGAVAYAMGKVDLVVVGAEGVVENGGIISRLGTYQIGILAKEAKKPFYVVVESHKFVRLYPLGQYDLPIDQHVIEFKTGDDDALDDRTPMAGDMKEFLDKRTPVEPSPPSTVDAVDYTPPHLITALITESGVLTPSAVSEELIGVYSELSR